MNSNNDILFAIIKGKTGFLEDQKMQLQMQFYTIINLYSLTSFTII